MDARAKLAALRAKTPKEKLAAIRESDRMFVEPTAGEALASSSTALVAGAGRGIASLVTLPADAMADVMTLGPIRRGIRAAIKKSQGEAVTAEQMRPPMPRTELAARAAEDFRKTGNRLLGVRPNIINDVGESMNELAGEVLAPGPEIVAQVRGAMKPKMPKPTAAELASRPVAEHVDAPKIPVKVAADIEKLVNSPIQATAPPLTPAATSAADEIPKYARPSSINLNRLNIPDEAKRQVMKQAEDLRPELEKLRGAPVSHDEVLEAAQTADILKKATSREETVKRAATALRTRQHLAALAEGKGVPADFVDTLRVMSAEAARAGRELNAFGIGADPALATTKEAIVKKLIDLGQSTDEIVKAAEGVDFTDAKQATDFYRKFVKADVSEMIDEYRYINLLSSPKTHIINAFSNMLQIAVVRPADRLASGLVDNFGRHLTGKEQEFFVRQVPAYYRGVYSNFGKALDGALAAMRGQTPLHRPDIRHIPSNNPILRPFQAIPRALEASDVFFRTLAEGGEFEALAKRGRIKGQPANEALDSVQAADTAREIVFRKPLDPENASGHGNLLAGIDQVTTAIYALRRVPGVKWFVPFVETPMNILKQGIEHSPLGFGTLYGSNRKLDQLGKASVGSTVFLGAGLMAMQGRTTWALPKNKKDREAFYAAGMQPFAMKIGDAWVSYERLGPIAYPIALAAAAKYYATDAPEATGKPDLALLGSALGGVAEFFSNQSYVEGLGKLLDAVRSEEKGAAEFVATVPGQLIPLASLQRWVTQIVDPVYRKAPKRLTAQGLIDNIKKGIPGLSDDLPAYTTPDGKPSQRQRPGVNAVAPTTITVEDPQGVRLFRGRQKAAQERARIRAIEEGRQ